MKKRRLGCWLKGALILAGLLLIAQTPSIYRRYQLGRLAATIQQLNAERAVATDDPYADYKGAIHVHSSLGGHSTGRLAEIIQGARANALAFVVMTEHPAADMDTAAQTLNGLHGGVLFVAGNETSESEQDHLLTFGSKPNAAPDMPAVAAEPNTNAPAAGNRLTTQDLIERAKRAGQLVFIAHPEMFSSWQTAHGFDGMEIYNLHANAKQINRFALFFDGLWSYRSYPQLLWTRFYETPTENLQRWDELTAHAGRRVVAIAANDAHANVGLSLQELTGKPILQIKLDPYERSFQVVRTHVLIEKNQPLTTDTLLNALAAGHAYVSFDVLCDASGFRLMADNGQERKLLGDEIALRDGVRLRISTPVACQIILIKDGQRFDEARGTEREWTVNQAGVYRVECYLPQLPVPLNQKPWIISNPVYVK